MLNLDADCGARAKTVSKFTGMAREKNALMAVATKLLQAQDLRAAMETVVSSLESGIEASRVMILSQEGRASGLRILACNGKGDLPVLNTKVVEDLYLRTLVNQGPLILNDISSEQEQIIVDRLGGSAPFRWMSCAIGDNGQPFGMICIFMERSGPFPDRDSDFLQSSATLLSAAITRLRSESRLNSYYQQLDRDGLLRGFHILADCLLHEVNQPITAALMYLYTCQSLLGEKESSFDVPEIKRFQTRAIEEIQRIHRIAGDLRRNLRDRDLDDDKEDVNCIIETALTMLRFDIEKMNIRVERNLHPDIPEIKLDKAMIIQLFFNLLRAVVDAMYYSIRRVITVSTYHHSPDRLEVRISASAPGMREGFLRNPYVSGSLSDARSSDYETAACRYIIDVHDGAFSVSKNEGGGSTFHIILPVNE